MERLGRLFSRVHSNMGSRLRKRAFARRLRFEQLEGRQLLAGDLCPYQDDLRNAENRRTPVDLPPAIDVTSQVEAVEPLISLQLGVREHHNGTVDPLNPGNPPVLPGLLSSGSRTTTIAVGNIVDLEVSYEDLRRLGGDIGAFTIFADLFTPNPGVTFSDYVEPIVTETQDLLFSSSLADAEGGAFVFSLDAPNSPTVTVSAAEFLNDPVGRISEALRSFGFTETVTDGMRQFDQFQVTRLPGSDQPDAPFEYCIRFLGDAIANQQVPNVNVDVSSVTSSELGFDLTVETLEIPAIHPDGALNGAAIPFSIDTHSRTYQNNSPFYNLSNAGTFTADGYDEVGGVGQILFNGIEPFIEPFDAFSLPVRIIQPIQNLVIQLGAPDTSAAAVLLYPGGDGDALSGDTIQIVTADDPATSEDDRVGLVVLHAVERTLVADQGNITLNEDLAPPGGNTIDLLGLVEDTANPNADITIQSVTNGLRGAVSVAGSVATYVPNEDADGSDRFTFVASSDGNIAIGTVSVTINPINDPPTVNAAVTAKRSEEDAVFVVDLLQGAQDPDATDRLMVSGMTLESGNPAGITVGEASLAVDPSRYESLAYLDQEVITYSYAIIDGNGGSVRQTATITIMGLDPAPVITGVSAGPLLYRQDQPPLPITPFAEIVDSGKLSFNGSRLSVEPRTTPQVGDRWLLRSYGDFTTTGDSVVVGGATIGTFTGGSDGVPLVVDFNSAATLAAVRATLRAVAFVHETAAPDEADQEVVLTLRGGTRASSKPVPVSITKWNRPDRPLIDGLGPGAHYREGVLPVPLAAPLARISDPDQHADFGGGKLTVRMVRNADSFDRLALPAISTFPTGVRADGSSVYVWNTFVGTLTQNGAGTKPLQVVFNGSATADRVTAVARAVRYKSMHPNLRVASKDVQFDFVDPEGISAFPAYKLVTLEATNDPAVLNGISGTSVIYNENAVPRTVATGAVLADPDYNGGGSLSVAITAGGASQDRLRVLHQGMGTNQVGVESNRVYFSGVQVGTISGGVGTNPMIVTLNSRATVRAVQSVARVVQYWSTSEQPDETPRTLAYAFDDGAGATTPAETAQVVVNSLNDLPLVANLGADLTTASGGAAIQVSTSVTISDVDSPNFDGGLFRARIASGATAADLLSIRHIGSGADQIAVSGNAVYWSGTLIGTFSGGSGSSILQVSLNGEATPLAVQRLARNILFRTMGAGGDRRVEFQLWDGDGAITSWSGKTISVTAATNTALAALLGESIVEDEGRSTLGSFAEQVDAIFTNR